MKMVDIEMRQGNGKWYKNGRWTLIDNLDDLESHLDLQKDTSIKEMIKLFKSELPFEKWDHYNPKTDAGALHMAIGLSKIEGTNPIYNVDKCLKEIGSNKLASFIKYGAILINNVGGYFPMTEDVRVLKETLIEEHNRVDAYINIKNDTRYLNLENDPCLESFTKEELTLLDSNFSYIVNLRDLSEKDLETAMLNFYEKGGSHLWMYTTGSDVEQMYLYSGIALKNGIGRFTFIFNSGKTEDIKDFVSYLSNNAEVDVTYIGE